MPIPTIEKRVSNQEFKDICEHLTYSIRITDTIEGVPVWKDLGLKKSPTRGFEAIWAVVDNASKTTVVEVHATMRFIHFRTGRVLGYGSVFSVYFDAQYSPEYDAYTVVMDSITKGEQS